MKRTLTALAGIALIAGCTNAHADPVDEAALDLIRQDVPVVAHLDDDALTAAAEGVCRAWDHNDGHASLEEMLDTTMAAANPDLGLGLDDAGTFTFYAIGWLCPDNIERLNSAN